MSKSIELAFGVVILALLVLGYMMPNIAGVEDRLFAISFSEDFTPTAYNTPISLSHTNISNWTVYNSTMTFQNATDYTVDAVAGTISIIPMGESSGSMEITGEGPTYTYTIDYYHDENIYTGYDEDLLGLILKLLFIGVLCAIAYGLFFRG